MANPQDVPPLEEITWRSPGHVQGMGGYLHSNNILFYFAESPFFDGTSNNASLTIQASYNENFRHFIETRAAFEARLKTMQGLEFVVAHDPIQSAAQPDGTFSHEPSNVWVIRKQTRRKRPGMEDEVTVLSTYFVVDDAIYMAPSVASVIGSRMLSAVTSLSKGFSVASSLPLFSVSYGHTYTPPATRTLDVGSQGQGQQSSQSQQSKEDTPMPDVAPSSAGAAGSKSPLTDTAANGSTIQDTRTFAEAFGLFSRYEDEFMDDSPLVGEPGSFILSKASDPAPPPKPLPTITTGIAAGTGGKSSAAPTPSPLRVDTPTLSSAKGSAAGDRTPTTPGGTKDKLKKKKNKLSTTGS